MKKGILMVNICAISLMMLTGCGGSDQSTPSEDIIVETVNEPKSNIVNDEADKDIDEDADKTDASVDHTETESGFADLTTDKVPEAENVDTDKFTDELCGSVETINSTEGFVIISKIFTESGSEIAVQPAEGSSDEELITVYFTGEAEYILETGKADGSNVTQTKVSFLDIAEGDTLELKGKFDTRGEEFLAMDIKIIRVIE